MVTPTTRFRASSTGETVELDVPQPAGEHDRRSRAKRLALTQHLVRLPLPEAAKLAETGQRLVRRLADQFRLRFSELSARGRIDVQAPQIPVQRHHGVVAGVENAFQHGDPFMRSAAAVFAKIHGRVSRCDELSTIYSSTGGRAILTCVWPGGPELPAGAIAVRRMFS